MLDPKPKVAVEQSVQDEQKKQLKLIGRMRPYRGHKLWKMNTKGEISEVGKDEYESYYDFSRKANVRKLTVEPDTLYASALNEKNARKKFDKLIKENSKQ